MFIDLNCDMGESFGDYRLGRDDEVIAHITSANLACGFHASDPLTMDRTVRLCSQHGVALGAHPGYPDLRGFGRRNLASTPEEVRGDVLYQVGALAAIARARGAELQHVKPHGAMYNTAASHPPTAKAIAAAVAEYDPGLILVTLAGPGGRDLPLRGPGDGPQGGQRGLCRPGLHPRGPPGAPGHARRGDPRPRSGGRPLRAHGHRGGGGGGGRQPGAAEGRHHLRARRHLPARWSWSRPSAKPWPPTGWNSGPWARPCRSCPLPCLPSPRARPPCWPTWAMRSISR